MGVSPLVWGLTIAAIAGLLVFDFAFHVRKAHVPAAGGRAPAERERIFRALLAERDQIVTLGPKYHQKVRDEPALMELLERARVSHDAAVRRGEAVTSPPPHS
jgi:hypothetical protein